MELEEGDMIYWRLKSVGKIFYKGWVSFRNNRLIITTGSKLGGKKVSTELSKIDWRPCEVSSTR